MNPCPCGWLGNARCRCTADQVQCYCGKILGPLLDRIDLHVDVPTVPQTELTQVDVRQSNQARPRARVQAVFERQLARQGRPNASLANKEIEQHCVLDPAAQTLLRQAFDRLNLSARSYHRVLQGRSHERRHRRQRFDRDCGCG